MSESSGIFSALCRLSDNLRRAATTQEIGRLTEEDDGPPPFRRVFEAADQKGRETLPPLTFRRCLLEKLGFDLTERECENLLDYLVRAANTAVLPSRIVSLVKTISMTLMIGNMEDDRLLSKSDPPSSVLCQRWGNKLQTMSAWRTGSV